MPKAPKPTPEVAAAPIAAAEAAPLDRTLSAALLRLRLRSPFLAALALFARYEVTDRVPTAATDGETVYVNPDFWNPLPAGEQDGLLLHEVLHCALGHCWRRAERDPHLWNIAADIVINGMILAEPGAALPAGGLFDARLQHFGTEEVFELLERDIAAAPPLLMSDLLDAAPGAEADDSLGARARRQQQAGHWRGALQKAAAVARSLGGDVPAHLRRELEALDPARLDWRTALWRYLVRTPTDFAGFDRRFVGRGLYLETLEGETVRVSVCLDTSGSVTGRQMQEFAAEVQAILASYPHIQAELFFADAALHGPYALRPHEALPAAVGGGGTDFRPFFEHLATRQTDPHGPPGVAIYLTDGYGPFPVEAPGLPTLWVVTAGGLALESFPFGEAVRLG
ncbi:MAG: hypothetical protein JWP58_2066 [Hymenobacter sp.]|nr:hypothetical protein [Hymenobacter sp.]